MHSYIQGFALAFSVVLLPQAIGFALALARFAHAQFALTKIFEKKKKLLGPKKGPRRVLEGYTKKNICTEL